MKHYKDLSRNISIDYAASILHAMIPDSDINWRKLIFSPDYIIRRAELLEADVDVVFVRDWETREDDNVVKILLGNDLLSDSDTVVITDLCFGVSPPNVPTVDGAFLVSGLHIMEFVEAYRKNITSNFVDGDVVIAAPIDRRINVFHHEGAVFRIVLP
jgi:hypothetical protein